MRRPITLIAGFLGSGKTTLLRRLLALERAAGRRPALLMNEAGPVAIDTLLAQHQGPLRELLEGCLCCTLQGDLLLTLTELAREPFDHLFVETSGIADPVDLLDALASPEILDSFWLARVVSVVDAAVYPPPPSLADLVDHQIRAASHLVLSKTDLVDPSAANRTETLLRTLNPTATVARAIHGDVDPIGLEVGSVPERPAGSGVHVGVATQVWEFPEPIARDDLDALLAGLGMDIWRLKGIIRLVGETTDTVVQGVGPRVRYYPYPGTVGPPWRLVTIGPPSSSGAEGAFSRRPLNGLSEDLWHTPRGPLPDSRDL
ncbi:MAG TPA: CobW family GTP-binding protein [bacterium]|nr:CobW family GTP-binding protein [bacterium]